MAINRVVENTQTLDGLYGQLYACIKHNTSSIIKQIKCKTCIISGNEDILVNPIHSEYLQRYIPNSKLNIINHAAHMIQLEQADNLSKLLLAF